MQSDFTTRDKAIQTVQAVAKVQNAFDHLESSLKNLSKSELGEALLSCGIIPESFAHDSSEEKLWAKYCDILLAKALTFLDIQSDVLRARGNSADVFGKASDYSIVGDAKAFRLSRTAKNQKDFKISALDDWRKDSTYACLIAPLYQYPTGRSQIYRQSESKNVMLLSYIHLRFLLDLPPRTSLIVLWETPKTIVPSEKAADYWQAIQTAILNLTGQTDKTFQAYKQMEIEQTRQIGREGIAYWESVIADYQSLSKEDAIKQLIKAHKVEEKIRTIKKVIVKETAV